LVLFMAVVTPKAHATSTTSSEYKVKAAFLYNFIKFVDWPKGKIPDGNEPIIIAIIGNVSGDPFGKAFEPIKDKSIKGRNVVIMRFKSLKEIEESRGRNKSTQEQQIEEIRKCHLLFIHSSEKDRLKKILNMVKDHHVLTVEMRKIFSKQVVLSILLWKRKKFVLK
jgi:hypothetical protein